jgi:catechol 2,3-dioxygenase-like lactoylglutathione lyase family enzyme
VKNSSRREAGLGGPFGNGPGVNPQPRIASLGHVGIFVTDLARSLAFYRDLLGLFVTDTDDANGMIFLSSRPDEEHHEFLICRGREAAPDVRLIQQISFRCATLGDVIGFWERLKAAGVEFDRIVSHGNAVGVYFFDPDRNRCEVYWPTGFKARQTFLAHIDLTQPVEALMAEIKAVVERYGETGYVDPRLLRN